MIDSFFLLFRIVLRLGTNLQKQNALIHFYFILHVILQTLLVIWI